MNKELLAGIVVSSLIFAFPRKFPVQLYTKIRKFFKGKPKNTDSPAYAYDPHLTPEEAQIEEFFRRACKVVQNASSLSDKQQLALYGLYKQALFGDCDKPKPKESDFVELKKWEAWNDQKGRTNKGAKEEYVRIVERFVPSAKIREGDFAQAASGNDEDDVFLTDEEYRKLKQDDKKRNLGMMFSRPVEDNTDALPEEADIDKFFKLIDAEDLEKIEQAIKNGFDLYKDSNAGMKAIHYAIENEKESVVELLCEHYTDLNVPDETGMTPLHYAVAHEDEGIIDILLKKDVDINQQDQGGESAYDLASARIKKFINAHKKDAESSE